MAINFKEFTEALKGGQKKLDVNKNGKLDAADFAKLRGEEAEMAEAADMHPDAQKVLKHIKPEHHAKYTPDLTKKHYTGSYADRTAVLSAAEKAGHLKEEVESNDAHYEKQSKPMQEAINMHLRKGKSYKEACDDAKMHVKEEVELDEGTGSLKPGWMLKQDPELAKKVKEKTDLAKKRQATYGDKSAGKSVKEETKQTYLQLIKSLAEAKKVEDDQEEDDKEEKGEDKIEKRSDRKADKLGRLMPKPLKGIKVHDGDDDGKQIGEEVIEIEEGEVVKTKSGTIHKGTYGSDYETDREGNEKKKVAAPAEKRGRGRPKKGSDSSGEVKKYTFHSLLNKLSTPSK